MTPSGRQGGKVLHRELDLGQEFVLRHFRRVVEVEFPRGGAGRHEAVLVHVGEEPLVRLPPHAG